ncbi:hypothetical protein BD408DRAFT_407590 [Parasitella parasitica]|nr:hypothetical protein BD408DRAFT_407590 [Parasitella parasitica]
MFSSYRKVDAHLDADKEPDSLNISGVALEILQQLEEIKRLINAGMTEISEKQKAAHKEAQLFQQRILDIVSGNNVPITSPCLSPCAIPTATLPDHLQYTAGGVSIYTMAREISSVKDLWKKWILAS